MDAETERRILADLLAEAERVEIPGQPDALAFYFSRAFSDEELEVFERYLMGVAANLNLFLASSPPQK